MNKYEISACYFPNFHLGDKHNEKYHGKGWNEWTEGSYLEPDTKYGYGRLEAIKKIFS